MVLCLRRGSGLAEVHLKYITLFRPVGRVAVAVDLVDVTTRAGLGFGEQVRLIMTSHHAPRCCPKAFPGYCGLAQVRGATIDTAHSIRHLPGRRARKPCGADVTPRPSPAPRSETRGIHRPGAAPVYALLSWSTEHSFAGVALHTMRSASSLAW